MTMLLILLVIVCVSGGCTPFYRLSPVSYNNSVKDYGNVTCCAQQAIFDSDHPVLSEIPVSQFVYYWGKLIFNDIALENTSAQWDLDAISCLNDTQHKTVSGLDCATPALDASFLYGSSYQTTLALREFTRGHLKLTSYGEIPHACDPSIVEKFTGPLSTYSEMPCAGDPRSAETLQLLSLQTLFVMEHNRICEDILHHRDDHTDDQIFNIVRNIIIGIVQKITFEEWLPQVIGTTHPIAPYVQPAVSISAPIVPRTSQEFALLFPSVFISSENNRVLYSDQNQELDAIPLDQGFYSPSRLHLKLGGPPGVCSVVTGMLRDPLVNLGLHVPASLIERNYPSKYCTYVRDALTPKLIELYPQLTSLLNVTMNPMRLALVRSLFADGTSDSTIVEKLDLYLGLSIEDHGPGDDDIMGPLLRTLLITQLVNNTRDRDINWYEARHFGGLGKRHMQIIQKTSMGSILTANCEFVNNLESAFGLWAVSDVKIVEETDSNLNDSNEASVIAFVVIIGVMFIVLVVIVSVVLLRYPPQSKVK